MTHVLGLAGSLPNQPRCLRVPKPYIQKSISSVGCWLKNGSSMFKAICLETWSNFTNTLPRDWNHQLVYFIPDNGTNWQAGTEWNIWDRDWDSGSPTMEPPLRCWSYHFWKEVTVLVRFFVKNRGKYLTSLQHWAVRRQLTSSSCQRHLR